MKFNVTAEGLTLVSQINLGIFLLELSFKGQLFQQNTFHTNIFFEWDLQILQGATI